jgi:SAM-dependent methyltransferase
MHPAIPEAYDRSETQVEDVALIRRLIGEGGPQRILEPFCGTGRLLIPLAQDGHELVGIDLSGRMLAQTRRKIDRLSPEVRGRIRLIHGDALAGGWPSGFDVVLLAGNCFYELASVQEQEGCIAAALDALKSGGHILVDNDHMETPLPESWTQKGIHKTKWPSGSLADGTVLEGYTENLDCDAENRIWRARRTIIVRHPDGRSDTYSFFQQKHPVSFGEVQFWLEKHGFNTEQTFGDRFGGPYNSDSLRATFWARKEVKA